MWVQSLDREDPLEVGMQHTPLFLPGESHGQRNLGSGGGGYGRLGCKESDMTEVTQHTLNLLIRQVTGPYPFSLPW